MAIKILYSTTGSQSSCQTVRMKAWLLSFRLLAVCISVKPWDHYDGSSLNPPLSPFFKSHHDLGSLVFSYKGFSFVPDQHKSPCRDCAGNQVTWEIV